MLSNVLPFTMQSVERFTAQVSCPPILSSTMSCICRDPSISAFSVSNAACCAASSVRASSNDARSAFISALSASSCSSFFRCSFGPLFSNHNPPETTGDKSRTLWENRGHMLGYTKCPKYLVLENAYFNKVEYQRACIDNRVNHSKFRSASDGFCRL